jgi:hypothetical protein
MSLPQLQGPSPQPRKNATVVTLHGCTTASTNSLTSARSRFGTPQQSGQSTTDGGCGKARLPSSQSVTVNRSTKIGGAGTARSGPAPTCGPPAC